MCVDTACKKGLAGRKLMPGTTVDCYRSRRYLGYRARKYTNQ
jgi:hypothetical protein